MNDDADDGDDDDDGENAPSSGEWEKLAFQHHVNFLPKLKHPLPQPELVYRHSVSLPLGLSLLIQERRNWIVENRDDASVNRLISKGY